VLLWLGFVMFDVLIQQTADHFPIRDLPTRAPAVMSPSHHMERGLPRSPIMPPEPRGEAHGQKEARSYVARH
jgi:hypothetical protein